MQTEAQLSSLRFPILRGNLCRNFQFGGKPRAKFLGQESQNLQSDYVRVVAADTYGGKWMSKGVPLLEDLLINGSNRSSLVVEYAEHQLGPSKEVPHRTFYIYTPVVHWNASPTIDESAYRSIEHLADGVFRFGQQTEHHKELLLDG